MPKKVKFHEDRISLLRLDLGPDSLVVLCLLADKKLVAGGSVVTKSSIDAAVFSDTGAEMPHTYSYLPLIRRFCRHINVPFYALMKPPKNLWAPHLKVIHAARSKAKAEGTRFRGITPPWKELLESATREEKAAGGYYHSRAPILEDIASKGALLGATDRSCADNHKMIPLRALVNEISLQRFGLSNTQWGIRVGKALARPHLFLDGLTPEQPPRHRKHPAYEHPVSPLREMGIFENERKQILARFGFSEIKPSRCYLCRKHSIDHFESLAAEHPDLYRKVRAYEGMAKGRLFKGASINDHLLKRRERRRKLNGKKEDK